MSSFPQPTFQSSKSDTPRKKRWLTTAEDDEGETIKDKVMETLNNLRYEMSTGAALNKKSMLCLLGHCYHFGSSVFPGEGGVDSTAADDRQQDEMPDQLRQFLLDFTSRIWLTYRKGFPPFPGAKTTLTSDTGWGCMLRTGQMMLAQGLVTHSLGRDWRWLTSSTKKSNTLKESQLHRDIVKTFLDSPDPSCHFGVHMLSEIGLAYKCDPGDWYGPATVAYMLQDAVQLARGKHRVVDGLTVYVAQDCTVYTQDVVEMCEWDHDHRIDHETTKSPTIAQLFPTATTNGSSNADSSLSDSLESFDIINHTHLNQNCSNGAVHPSDKRDSAASYYDSSPEKEQKSRNKSVIIFIPVRIGEVTLNPIYIPCLQSILSMKQSIGIIGGKPRHSLYFVGFQDEYLIYMDPHYCQSADDVYTFSNKELQSYHCTSPRKVLASKLDPSCCFGFYCTDYQDFKDCLDNLQKFAIPPKQKANYPLCMVVDGKACDQKLACSESMDIKSLDEFSDAISPISHNSPEKDGPSRSESSSNGSKATSSKSCKSAFDFRTAKTLVKRIYKENTAMFRRSNSNGKVDDEDFEFL